MRREGAGLLPNRVIRLWVNHGGCRRGARKHLGFIYIDECGVSMDRLTGALVWFFPPMVARILYGEEIMALTMDNPANASYSYIARQVLPSGLMGVMIAAMLAATMSIYGYGASSWFLGIWFF